MEKLLAYLRLTRPANIVTAISDIWAGFAIAGATAFLLAGQTEEYLAPFLWLTLATIGLYGGGVAFNDVFDAELDKVERPERPIPSGQVPLGRAILLSLSLLLMGIIAGFKVSYWSGELAVFVAAFAVLYDAWGKHQRIFGPINMGLCRSANLLLGMSVIPESIGDYWYVALIPLAYISAITMISRGEVHGQNKIALQAGFGLYLLILVSILTISLRENGMGAWQVLPLIVLFGYMILPPLWKAMQREEPALIGKAVKSGVIALIVMNAALAAAFAGIWIGLAILPLLPISLWLAKKFAVT
ncbi:UbiA-like protein EboC [Lunatibacter salilacus]|uniref:UbiA-like protein EboC n=1 Tax=Lunatibacter salilacus TaxID=2483804 RepID=UPI00131A70AC|nr:UbiA-like protein EboC [Lunatibacter salilacus]